MGVNVVMKERGHSKESKERAWGSEGVCTDLAVGAASSCEEVTWICWCQTAEIFEYEGKKIFILFSKELWSFDDFFLIKTSIYLKWEKKS